MAKEWTDDEVQAEIAEAVRIYGSDHHGARLARIEETLAKRFGNNDTDDGGKDKDTEGKPPPAKDPKDSNATPKKSIWWGEAK